MRKQKFNRLCWVLIPILFISLITYYKLQNATIFASEGEKTNFSQILAKDKENDSNNVRSVSVKPVSNDIMIYPGGQPIGVKLNTKGVLVVALSDLDNGNSKVASPAALAGIEIGDSIIKINGEIINNSEQISRVINSSDGGNITIEIERKGEKLTKTVKPVKSLPDNYYKVGLWVRDSTAGVGTLTFYDEKSGIFGALGHPITDIDTGTILSVNSGEIVSSSINSLRKGTRGNPGELRGIFVNEDLILGNINKNTECGIFGKSNTKLINKYNKPLPIAMQSEIKEGPAQILTTINGEEPSLYDVKIQKLLPQDSPGSKSMLICITDPILLEKTGGIVQGMSGSPIIQNGKIIGAVTHVLINKPDTGYGIYIEWMLKEASIF